MIQSTGDPGEVMKMKRIMIMAASVLLLAAGCGTAETTDRGRYTDAEATVREEALKEGYGTEKKGVNASEEDTAPVAAEDRGEQETSEAAGSGGTETVATVDNGVTIIDNETKEDAEMSEEVIEQIKSFLMENVSFGSESAVYGAASRLYEAGCSKAVGLSLVDDTDGVYMLELSDDKGQVFCFSIDHKGYIGPVRDKNGNYLYTPID